MKGLLTIFLLAHFIAAAQTDSSHIKRLEFSYMMIDGHHLCFYRSRIQVIQSDSVWNYVQQACESKTGVKPDFTKFTVWQRTSAGDCHATFSHDLFMDTLAKKIIWVEYNYYGGCRAAKVKETRIQFPTPPEGYTFELRKIRKERWK